VIAKATSKPPALRSVAELSHVLSRYERPDRRELARAVYRRWRTSPSTAPGLSDAQTSGQFTLSKAELQELKKQRRRTRNVTLAVCAAVLVLVMVMFEQRVITEIRRFTRTVALETAAFAENAGPTLAAAVDNGIEWLASPFSRGARAPASGIASARVAAPSIAPARRVRANASPSRPQPQTVALPATRETQAARPLVSATEIPAPSSSPAASPASAAAPGLDPGTVYSLLDPDVTPPVPIDRQLLDSPPSGSELSVALDVVVDETGRVQSATPVRRPGNMREAMFVTMSLSAAKTWRFQPAQKNGQPVKYRRRAWLISPD